MDEKSWRLTSCHVTNDFSAQTAGKHLARLRILDHEKQIHIQR